VSNRRWKCQPRQAACAGTVGDGRRGMLLDEWNWMFLCLTLCLEKRRCRLVASRIGAADGVGCCCWPLEEQNNCRPRNGQEQNRTGHQTKGACATTETRKRDVAFPVVRCDVLCEVRWTSLWSSLQARAALALLACLLLSFPFFLLSFNSFSRLNHRSVCRCTIRVLL